MIEKISPEELIKDLDEKKEAQEALMLNLDKLFSNTDLLKAES